MQQNKSRLSLTQDATYINHIIVMYVMYSHSINEPLWKRKFNLETQQVVLTTKGYKLPLNGTEIKLPLRGTNWDV
jgi:hypothetical protein